MGSSSSRKTGEPVIVKPVQTVETTASPQDSKRSDVKMPKYTLINFNVRGRGEVSRILFALAGVEYEDKRLPFEGDEWPNLKPQMPFGQMPALKIDDVILCQAEACEFYIARTYGFAGSGPMDEARILMIGNCVNDTLAPLFKLHSLPEDATEAKAEIMKKYVDEQMPNYFRMLENMLVFNKGGNGYFVGNKISMADIQIVGLYDWLDVTGIELDMTDYPKMKAHKVRITKEPRYAAWVEKRPKTRF